MSLLEYQQIVEIAKSVTAVSQNGGIFSKVLTALIFLTICMTVIACVNPVTSSIAILVLPGLFLIIFIGLILFAMKYPSIAVFDGKQLLQYRQLQIQSKNETDLDKLISLTDENIITTPTTTNLESEVNHVQK